MIMGLRPWPTHLPLKQLLSFLFARSPAPGTKRYQKLFQISSWTKIHYTYHKPYIVTITCWEQIRYTKQSDKWKCKYCSKDRYNFYVIDTSINFSFTSIKQSASYRITVICFRASVSPSHTLNWIYDECLIITIRNRNTLGLFCGSFYV